jgi:hypothetical protein
MQFLGPAPNGMKLKGCLSSFKNLSGINCLALGKYISFQWRAMGYTMKKVPLGNFLPPNSTEYSTLQF